MLYNIKYIPLQCVFHGIRFKVSKDWLSGDNQFFFCTILNHHINHLSISVLQSTQTLTSMQFCRLLAKLIVSDGAKILKFVLFDKKFVYLYCHM